MEHLCLPDGAKSFIIAPYNAPEKEQYYGEGFLQFPEQRGWTEEQVFGSDKKTETGFKPTESNEAAAAEIEQFFQTWLFFGLVIEVLKVGGVVVQTEDFLQKKNPQYEARIVYTSKLPNLMIKWEQNIRKMEYPSSPWNRLEEYFRRAATVLDHFCGEDDEDLPLDKKPRPWPVRDEISTTIIALVAYLRRAAIISCDVGKSLLEVWPKAACSAILARHLERKWCIADVTITMKQLPIDGLYYLASSPGLNPDELGHHVNCVKERCLYKYDHSIYVTKHTTIPWHKQCCKSRPVYGGQLGPEREQKGWDDALARILMKADEDGNPTAFPIAFWEKGSRTLWSVEYYFKGTIKPDYVAISHIWADGKGNPKENALPECQIDKIQNLIEEVKWEGRNEIPLNESDSISFWIDTLCVPAKSTIVKDEHGKEIDLKAAAIKTMRHVYTNARAVLVLDDWIEAIPSTAPPLEISARLYQSNWLKRLWTHQEGFLPPVVWFRFKDRSVQIENLDSQIEEHVTMLQNQGLYLGFPGCANLRLSKLYGTLRFIMGGMTADSKWMLYLPIGQHLLGRQTSRLADEVICLATIIDIPVDKFLKIPSKPDNVSGERRMECFLEVLGKFDANVIFNNYERLTKKGYKWAPKSLLNFTKGYLLHGDIGPAIPFEEINGQRGLLVHKWGFLVGFPDGKMPFAAAGRGCAIQCKVTDMYWEHLNGKWYVVRLPRNTAAWVRGVTYAVILSELPREKEPSPAVVAAVLDGSPDSFYTADHRSIASVSVQDEQPLGLDIVEAVLETALGYMKWLVV